MNNREDVVTGDEQLGGSIGRELAAPDGMVSGPRPHAGLLLIRRVLLNATLAAVALGMALALAEIASRMVNQVTLPNFVNDDGQSQSFFRPDATLAERTEPHLHG